MGPGTWSRKAAKTAPLTAPFTLSSAPSPSGGERDNERHVCPAVQRHGLVQALAVGRAAVAAAIGQGGAGPKCLRRISSTNTERVKSSSRTVSTNKRRSATTRSAAWMLFFAFPAQLFHGPPHARAAQHRAYFGKGGIGLLAQTGRKLGVARRVQARGRTTAGGQGSERIGRALMVQEFVHEGNRDAEAGGHLIHSGSRLDTHGRHPFPQINRIRFHP